MNNMLKQKLSLFVVFIALVSCSEEEPVGVIDENIPDEIEVVTPDFVGERFDNPSHLELLEELNICDLIASDSSITALCSPENFEIMEFRSDKGVKESFIVQTKAGISLKGETRPLPVRHLMVFEREKGELVRVNGFRGEVVALEKSDDNIKDLLVSFYFHDERAVFVCLFKWENEKYSFESVEGIDWNEGLKPIKANMKDSISAQVYNDLMERNLLF